METITSFNESNTFHRVLTEEEAKEFLSKRCTEGRIKRLIDSDWTDTLSAKTRLGDDLYNRWQEYRQAIRDMPLQEGYPFKVVWPSPPV